MDASLYFDYAATTPVAHAVLGEMLPYFSENFGNPASNAHLFGKNAKIALEHAREQVASLFGANSQQLYFNSGSTEGINTVIKGVFAQHQYQGHIITAQTEHKAVLDVCHFLETLGASVTYLPVNAHGLIDMEQLVRAFRPDTILVSIMWVNNETGVIQDVERIAQICQDRKTLFFTDATQAAGKIPISGVSADFAAISGHKIYGPKGIGALFIKNPRALEPLLHGGGHERGIRSGTPNVPGIVGLGKACEIIQDSLATWNEQVMEIGDYLENGLTLLGAIANGKDAPRVPHIRNLQFFHKDSNEMMAGMPHIAVSAGSACSSYTISPSHVLKAMGLSDDASHHSLRFSLSHLNTKAQVDEVVRTILGLQA
jgi:cysteine desulfurase